jgi:hypothetical protein
MKAKRRDESMEKPGTGDVRNAVTSRKNGPTKPMAIPNQVAPAMSQNCAVRNAVTKRSC